MNASPPTAPLVPAPDRLRASIVAAAQALYLQQGIAEVAMADVARYLRLPESTVLHWFAAKTTLVEAVVEAHAQVIYEEIDRHKAHSSTAVEELLALRNWASEEMRPNLAAFFQQLAADYPAGQRCWEAHMAGVPMEHLRNNLRWGILQDLYHPGLDVERLVQRWFQHTGILRTGAGVNRGDMHRSLFEQFIADIVTPAGALVLRRLQEAEPFY